MNNWKNIKYIILTAGLLAFLMIPFMLKLKRAGLEVYPSIIMPSGASLIYKTESINFRSYELYARKEGRLKKINIKAFLAPIPEWYLFHIASSDFGFNAVSRSFELYKPPIKIRKYNRFNSSQLQNVKTYYREKLEKLGFDDSIFIYRCYKHEILNSLKNKTLVYEKYYNLK